MKHYEKPIMVMEKFEVEEILFVPSSPVGPGEEITCSYTLSDEGKAIYEKYLMENWADPASNIVEFVW